MKDKLKERLKMVKPKIKTERVKEKYLPIHFQVITKEKIV